jgi:hypothetical protein
MPNQTRIHPLWCFDTGLRATLNKPLKGFWVRPHIPKPLAFGVFLWGDHHDQHLETTHATGA